VKNGNMNKEIVSLKLNQKEILKLKSTITVMKSSPERFNADRRMNTLEHKTMVLLTLQNREKQD
jgi:hypothetical protein